MKNLDIIAEELFNKIRGRFPSVTIGNGEGKVTNKPTESRFYDFDYVEGDRKLGRVSISLTDEAVEVMYSNDFVANEDIITRENWYDFLKELRQFSKKRMLNFDTRNINKSNLDQRDYKFLATNRSGDEKMNESKMYGTSKTSYQRIGEARIAIKHSKPVDTESATGRIQNISAIYIESADGERFKYPYKHLNGARAMARHVSEGGKPYDDFGSHITGLSEELNSLKKFKSYVGRSSVMAEGLSGYMLPVNERLEEIKKTISSLQKESTYRTAFESFEKPVLEDVPSDVAENWIDQLTIKQFNEELKDVFPFVYRLVSEATKAKIVGAEDILGEGPLDWAKDKWDQFQQGREDSMREYEEGLDLLKRVLRANGYDDNTIARLDSGCLNDPRVCLYNEIMKNDLEMGDMDVAVQRIGDELNSGFSTRGATFDRQSESFDNQIESSFEEMMGQFGERVTINPDGSKTPSFAQTLAQNAEKAKASGNDLGNGFELVDTKVLGRTVKGVLDTESGETIVVNKGITRSPARYLIVKPNGNVESTMEVGPQTMKALQQGGLAEGNKFTAALAKAKANDDDEMEVDGKKIPVTEFILSMYDRETGQFPKGETAVLTAIEKDYGEQFINPAKAFIEAINAKFEEINGYRDPELMDDMTDESALMGHIGKKKYGKDGMAALSQAGRDGASEEELGRIKDKYKKESEDLRKLAGL